MYHAPDQFLVLAMATRNEMLTELSRDPKHSGAYLIVSAPEASERATWRQTTGASRVVVLATPLEECIARIKADPRRAGMTEKHIAWARDWWNRYQPGSDEETI